MKLHSNFTRQQKNGVFFLLFLIAVVHLVFFGLQHHVKDSGTPNFILDSELQNKIDSLVAQTKEPQKKPWRPFNPNYISEVKGYMLGLTSTEMERLLHYRAQNNFVNSPEAFQEVTGVSDSLLRAIAPFFKFPNWVKKKAMKAKTIANAPQATIRDLNGASARDLMEIRGIGEKLSARIVKFRERLGGFLVNEQLYDVYGLDSLVVKRALEAFQILEVPDIKKISINTASVDEIADLIYIRYNTAKNIVSYRNGHGPFKSKDDLMKVPGFPADKIDRIELYLSY